MKTILKWPLGLITNPGTGAISHSKLWANVAAATGTYKFVVEPAPPYEVWIAYLGLVGGYAVARRWIAAKQQEKETNDA
ncbi:hypothetical protein [Snodgrassella sp. CFCC 13594]|uniref:hypothetical protein n=1 Tax=Snodgrassella sp. CFCC 13594 TaxID=1775559 RepID=UPI001E284316|nr:hypothetical protein [Snodgrassella sp. CFCC 13594]